mmetsp:Transcript_8631/g.16903  ORF Transcript_8631/g.16903 Transcript_8631/m.16903 type:complete len:245 (-) Transcript_8631:614-1348(-)
MTANTDRVLSIIVLLGSASLEVRASNISYRVGSMLSVLKLCSLTIQSSTASLVLLDVLPMNSIKVPTMLAKSTFEAMPSQLKTSMFLSKKSLMFSAHSTMTCSLSDMQLSATRSTVAYFVGMSHLAATIIELIQSTATDLTNGSSSWLSLERQSISFSVSTVICSMASFTSSKKSFKQLKTHCFTSLLGLVSILKRPSKKLGRYSKMSKLGILSNTNSQLTSICCTLGFLTARSSSQMVSMKRF